MDYIRLKVQSFCSTTIKTLVVFFPQNRTCTTKMFQLDFRWQAAQELASFDMKVQACKEEEVPNVKSWNQIPSPMVRDTQRFDDEKRKTLKKM